MLFFKDIYQLVKKIPRGRVVTYGEIARALGMRDARKVGWALHGNKDPEVPCHRVVNKDGRLAPNFVRQQLGSLGGQAFDGLEEQKRRLLEEEVKFVDEMHVDLDKHMYTFK